MGAELARVEEERDEARAALERVRALPDAWLRCSSPEDREGLEMAADDLRDALEPADEPAG